MHEGCRGKCRIGVANLTILGGWQMPCCSDEPWVVREELRAVAAFAATIDAWVDGGDKRLRGERSG